MEAGPRGSFLGGSWAEGFIPGWKLGRGVHSWVEAGPRGSFPSGSRAEGFIPRWKSGRGVSVPAAPNTDESIPSFPSVLLPRPTAAVPHTLLGNTMGPKAPAHPLFQAANREPQPRTGFATIQGFTFFLLRAAPGELSERGFQLYPFQLYPFQFSPSFVGQKSCISRNSRTKTIQVCTKFVLSLIPAVDSPVSNEKGICCHGKQEFRLSLRMF